MRSRSPNGARAASPPARSRRADIPAIPRRPAPNSARACWPIAPRLWLKASAIRLRPASNRTPLPLLRCAGGTQQGSDFGLRVVSGPAERRRVIDLVLDIEPRATFDHQPHHVGVATKRGLVQRRGVRMIA